jgi:hypothetical protein
MKDNDSTGRSALVIPTCRIESFRQFAASWSEFADWDATIIVVDGQETELYREIADESELPRPMLCCWQEIQTVELEQIISRRDSAIRSFGFLLAYHSDKKFDLICTLDDDCLPHPEIVKTKQRHAASHRTNMCFPAWQSTLDHQRVRGLPFSQPPMHTADVNIGLWEGVFDLSSVDQLAYCDIDNPKLQELVESQKLAKRNQVVPPNVQVPMCGMNLAFTRRAAPLMYFGLQGQGQPVGRFDDIWCGVIAKRICDHLGWSWTYGRPLVIHDRASNPFRNLAKEAPGIVEHEQFLPFIADLRLNQTSLNDCFREIAEAIRSRYKPIQLPTDYFVKLANAMDEWISLFF